ncbi:hypothetical protein ACFR9U_09180 [Halorientalis brevis]|uniref:Uncharacterized protein n=1 Tax=Halorientalis brevis TaxID=1126241 RepID=A0ABD6C9X6_9EURY|nr:hypothetical protein [Halorientalis brevis]
MPDHESVKRALARLAARSTGATSGTAPRLIADPTGNYRAVIDQASAAVQELSTAAAFVEADGLQRLAAAIDAAEAAGDHAGARRGREALSTFQRVRAAAEVPDRDHFHSGRGTHLGGGDEGAGK